jgi:quinol monooxygenase YgiN
MSQEIVSVIAQIRAKQGSEERLQQELTALVGPSRAEKGCINFDLHRAAEDRGLFFFYENWSSKVDLDKHLEEPHIKVFLSKTDDLLAEPIAATFWIPINTVGS